MPSAYAVAAKQYARPTHANDTSDGERDIDGRLLTDETPDIIAFFITHRTAYASHVVRYFPQLFKGKDPERIARRVLAIMSREGLLRIVTCNDPFQHNVYMLTDHGIDYARNYMEVIPESLPSRRREPKLDHTLHELLITEVAVDRHEFLRSNPEFDHLWEERFGFHRIPGFEMIVPDYAQLYRSPRGVLIDFVEVLSGERSITNVKQKLEKYDEWSRTADALDFLKLLYTHRGGVEDPAPVFRITIVAHNRNQYGIDVGWERQILNATFTIPQELQRRVWITTNAYLDVVSGKIDSPIWHCGVSIVPYRSQWNNLPKSQRTKFLSKVLAKTERQPLFTFPTTVPA